MWRLAVSGPEIETQISLPVGRTTIGRRSGNDLVLAHPFVSGQHARIDCTSEACLLTDLESTNGTVVEGKDVVANEALSLERGDVIKIGPFSLEVQFVEERPSPQPQRPAPPPAPPPPPPATVSDSFVPEPGEPPPGLTRRSERLLQQLPGIYHTDFMERFLAIFEATLLPLEWTVDNFDLFLSPRTAPAGFLTWLANWYRLTFDATWSEEQRRAMLADAPAIYARGGTRWALQRVLQIYTGVEPEIIEFEDEEDPFTFTVRLRIAENEVNADLVANLIERHKPAHTNYRLLFAST